MDIDQARTFLAIAAYGSFLEAARHLHLTQSTVSARIQRLEEALGARLFVRNRSGATLTMAGRRFTDYAKRLVLTAERGLTIDVCARHHQLPELHRALITLFERAPQARVVLDHLGKPDIAAADGDLNQAGWAANLKRLAALPNVFAKMSGLTAQDDWSARRDDVVRRYLDHALVCFEPDRLMFGGDWPVVNLAGGYGRWRDLFETAIAALPSLEREKIRTDTARAFYLGGADKDLSA